MTLVHYISIYAYTYILRAPCTPSLPAALLAGPFFCQGRPSGRADLQEPNC